MISKDRDSFVPTPRPSALPRSLNSSSRASPSSQASSASSRTSGGSRGDAHSDVSEKQQTSDKKEAATLVAKGVANSIGGAFLQAAAKSITRQMDHFRPVTDKKKSSAETKSGQRMDTHESKGKAQQRVGQSQIGVGLADLRGRSTQPAQARLGEAKDEHNFYKQSLGDMAKARTEQRQQDRSDAASGSAGATPKIDE